ncbi:MAG: alkaline phosphatase family protein [Verrucomicrobiota bacterium]
MRRAITIPSVAIASIGLVAALLTAQDRPASLAASPEQTSQEFKLPEINPRPYQVILVSVDGLRPDAVIRLGQKKAPHFHRLRREGAFTDNARTAARFTVTLPNHTGMVTSRLVAGEAGHNWTENSDPSLGMDLHRNKGEHIYSAFSVAHDYGYRTALFASKSKFMLFDISYGPENGAPDPIAPNNGRDKIDRYFVRMLSEPVVDELERTMKRETFGFTFLHIRNPDTAGHALSWTLNEPSLYMNAVRRADEMIGDVFEKIDTVPTWRGRTYLIVTADHGGPDHLKEHNEWEKPQNFTIPFYVWGPDVPRGADLYAMNPTSRRDPGQSNPAFSQDGTEPIRNADAGNLALSLLGLPPIPGSSVNAFQNLKVR